MHSLSLLTFFNKKTFYNLNDLRLDRTRLIQLFEAHRQGCLLWTSHPQCSLCHLHTHRLPPSYLLFTHFRHDAHLWLHDRLGAHPQLRLYCTIVSYLDVQQAIEGSMLYKSGSQVHNLPFPDIRFVVDQR